MAATTTGERIKYQRTRLGMTQEELGRRIGVTNATINKYEMGIVANLKRSTIDKLATALDVSPAYLMCWEDNSAPQAESNRAMACLLQDASGATGNDASSHTSFANSMTEEELELLRIYRLLTIKERNKLLGFAYKMEEDHGI